MTVNSSGENVGPGGPGGPQRPGGAPSRTIYAPIAGSPPAGTSSGQVYGAPRDGGSRSHAGVDIAVGAGTKCVAPVDGTVTMAYTSGFGDVGGMIHFQFDERLGDIPAGAKIGWGHAQAAYVSEGTKVQGGKIIGESGWHHVHFIYQPDGNGGSDGTADPTQVYNYLRRGEAPTGLAGGNSGQNGLGGGGEGLAKASAFATFFNLATVADSVRAQVLTGERSLMNDEPLFPFVQQITEASLRNFQSLPDGTFFAFYPDYFGGMKSKNGKAHRTPYWKIEDIEIIDGNINLSDDALATHVYIVGSWDNNSYAPTAIDAFKELQSAGVVTVFNAFQLDFLNGTTNMNNINDPFKPQKDNGKNGKNGKRGPREEDMPALTKKDNAIAFLKKYGARPYYEQMPLVKSRYYELFLAYQKFCLLWSQQFSTEFQLTFMPELFPGGLIEFSDYGIQCYVEEVSHNCSMTGGFTTNVTLSAPASTGSVSSKDNKNVGMIRAGIFGPGAS